jgi:hypothetical protein
MSLLLVFHARDVRPAQLGCKHLLDSLERRLHYRAPGNQHNVPTRSNLLQVGLYGLPKQALGPIALHSLSYCPTSHYTDAQCFNLIRTYNDHHQRMGECFSKPAYPLEICGPDEAEFAFHPCLLFIKLPVGKAVGSSRFTDAGNLSHKHALAAKNLAVPVDLLGMVVHFDRQAITASRPPGFEHFAPIGSRHALAKSVHAQTAPDFRLVGTFC